MLPSFRKEFDEPLIKDNEHYIISLENVYDESENFRNVSSRPDPHSPQVKKKNFLNALKSYL